ncbi:hypothetical protein PIB30_045210 [Stylosanthes scabra]|uniref:Uncharacterized protein n=1 Tax=Stylosanthes scabra TaxID=79078 RepID=A0ABU6RGR3_9FABA|nr:hypothetical protein [Stylosanthes scabra]
MESMGTGSCLWMVTNVNIFGIRIEKLEQLGKNEARNWNSILLFFAGGTPDSSPKIHQVSYAGGTTLDIAEAVAAGISPRDSPFRTTVTLQAFKVKFTCWWNIS